jgi:UDP-glucose 4-epimerase
MAVRSNVIGTMRVLEWMRRTGCPRMIYASSAAIYGVPTLNPVEETAALAPATQYGATKLTGEHLCRIFAEQHGIEAVALRYFNVYGPGQREDAYGNVIPLWTAKLLRGDAIDVRGDGHQTRDFVHVDDVVDANIQASLGHVFMGTHNTFLAANIGSGVATSLAGLAASLLAVTGRPWGEAKHIAPLPGEVRHCTAAISPAVREQLGWLPTRPITLTLLHEYVEWMKSQSAAQEVVPVVDFAEPPPSVFSQEEIVGKGSKRRPCFVSDEQLAENWDAAFGKPEEQENEEPEEKAASEPTNTTT